MTHANGLAQLVTWNHFDYGRGRPAQDSMYSYDVDPSSGLDRTIMLSGKQADIAGSHRTPLRASCAIGRPSR